VYPGRSGTSLIGDTLITVVEVGMLATRFETGSCSVLLKLSNSVPGLWV